MPPEIERKIHEFFAKYRIQRFKKGEILIFAGEPPDGIFYLTDGTVRQYDISKRGTEMVVNIFKPPAFFPMNYALNHHPNEYFFAAVSPITVRQAPEHDVMEFVRSNNDVTLSLLSRVYQGMDGVLRRQTLLMGGGATERLAYEIILTCHRFGERQKDGSFTVHMNETELATQVGLARETVSRQLQVLKEKKLISILPNLMIIINLHSLEALVHGSTQYL